MNKIELSDSEVWVVINALRCAADLYGKDADAHAKSLPYPANGSLSRQFIDQQIYARKLADRIEEEHE